MEDGEELLSDPVRGPGGLRGVQAPPQPGRSSRAGMRLPPERPRWLQAAEGSSAPRTAPAVLCPCRDRLARALPVRGLAWTRRQPRRLLAYRPRVAGPCLHTEPSHTQAQRPAPAHASPHPCPHTRVPHATRGGAGAGVPVLPRVSRRRAQFPPHCACPTALARSQRLDTPRRQPGPPR